jgi:arsenite-transporting ATPase
MGRIIIFTGKGGVGKTTVAAAHALKGAKEGKKTVIISTDMAHNLSDLFGKQLGAEPAKICDNLFAIEIDPHHEMKRHYDSIAKAFSKLVNKDSKEEIGGLEDIVAFPGIEELFSLIKIKELYDAGEYDLIVVDCAPTGETLSLLKFPELFSWYMEKIFPIGKVALKVLRPISKTAFKIELPDNEALNDMEKLYLHLDSLQSLLKNREVCSIRLVTIPEKMVVEETKRNYMYLNLYNFNVDGLYINRMIPDDLKNSFFDQWKEIQKKYVNELNMAFMHIPSYRIKWYGTDLNGISGLEHVVEDALSDKNLLKVLNTTANEVYKKTETGYCLEVYIPFVDKTEFDLYEVGTDLTIKIGNFKRNIPLPSVIRNYRISSAKLVNHKLQIQFEKEEDL